jgi:hypothetical protein
MFKIPISAGAGQHLVDADNVVRVNPNSCVEGILAHGFNQVLVGADTASLKSLARKLNRNKKNCKKMRRQTCSYSLDTR